MKKKISFKIQMIIAFIIIGIGHLIAYLSQRGMYINIAGVISGLLFIFNPVYPNIKTITSPKGIIGARIGGVLIIILTIVIKNGT